MNNKANSSIPIGCWLKQAILLFLGQQSGAVSRAGWGDPTNHTLSSGRLPENRRHGGWYLFGLLSLFFLLAACTPSSLNQSIALVGGTVFSNPDAPLLEDSVVLIEDGRILEVGPRTVTRVPRGAKVIDVAGMSILAGFWNTHVHFTEYIWENAASRDGDSLSVALEEMLLRWGFVRVVDTGSLLENTLALRERIRSGELTGPDILTTGMPFAPPNGNPFYVEPMQLPQLTTTAQSSEVVEAHFAAGADLLKVFAGSPIAPGSTAIMPAEVLRAAASKAHADGRIVVAHPTTNEGIASAVKGGMDILAHTTPDGGEPWDAALIADMRAADVAVVPTLTLWKWSLGQQGASEETTRNFVALAQEQVRAYREAGGAILFGTDVGFISEYDPTCEYVLLEGAGLTFREILRTLTTEPSQRFGITDAGIVGPDKSADLVVVNGRPDKDIRTLADVVAVYLRGDLVFKR